MKTYLEYKDEKSQKFWEITLNGSSHTVIYGKIGTTGQSKTLDFPSVEEAQKATDKLIQSKLKKGYKNVEAKTDNTQLIEPKQDNLVEKKVDENTLKEKDIEDAEYLVRIVKDYDNYVNVLKKVAESTYNIEWTFMLKEDNSSSFTLSEMFNEDYFIVVNPEAWVRIYSISRRELVFEKKYNANENSKALISNDKTKLYIAYKPEADPSLSFIKIISLTDFSIIKTIQLPKNFDISHFTLGADNRLLFYYVKEKPNSHGYNIVNEITKKIEHFLMEYPQWEEFRVKPPIISPKFNMGIMPYWNEIEVKKDTNNNPLFVFKVMLFNLTDFKVEKIIPIRDFTTQQLDKVRNFTTYQFDEKQTKAVCKKRAKIFQNKNIEDKNYKDAVKEFMPHLNSVVFEEASDSFWVCFRGGILRNVTLDGKLSPLFVTSLIPGYTDEGAFNFLHVETHIDTVEKNTIVLKVSGYSGYYLMPLNREELLSDKTIIEKELTKEKIRDQALNIDYLLPEVLDIDAQKDKIIEDTNYFIAKGHNEGGFNQIKVLKKISKDTYHLEWAFVLIGDKDTLVLSEMYDQDHLVIANGNAWVRIYSISKKELIFEKKYGGNRLSEALISKDKSKLYIAYGRWVEDTQERTATLEILSLTDFSSIKTVALPQYFDYEYFIQGKDNSLLFCSAKEEDPWADDITWKQGINVLNEATEKIDYVLLRDNLEEKPKTLDEFIKYSSKRTIYLQHGGIEIIASEEEEDSTFEEAKKVVIEVADLNQEKSYLEALDKMIKLTQDIDAIAIGNTLAFRVKDKNKKYEEDKVFFKKAIKVKGAAEKMEQIVTNFIKHQTPITETVSLYINAETTALAYTVYHLVASNPKYIAIAIQYLQVIYFGNDFFNKQNLIPLLKDKYHEKNEKQIIKRLKELDKIAGNWLLAYENHN